MGRGRTTPQAIAAWARKVADQTGVDAAFLISSYMEWLRRTADPKYAARERRAYATLCQLYPEHCKPGVYRRRCHCRSKGYLAAAEAT